MTIHVAAAAIQDPRGRVLISKRADHLHQGGLWEFPGGKVEPGESPLQALSRELQEELDITPVAIEPLIKIHHQYDDREVVLDVYRVSRYEGEAKGMEGQPLRWIEPGQMRSEDFPAADRPVITALQLPDRYLITGEDPADANDFLLRLENALKRQIELVQLRAHGLDDSAYGALLDQVKPLCQDYTAKLLLNRPENCGAWMQAADGIHLPAHQLMALSERPLGGGLVGASCHSREELQRASELKLDYVLLSPVKPTASHPGAVGLGWNGFTSLVERVNLPVYALGGMNASLLSQVKAAGGQGIAAIREFWN
jgi:8-oxo-dGTP diphosphatase